MPRADDVHVVANRMRGGWHVTRAGRRLSHHRTQKEAAAVGRSGERRESRRFPRTGGRSQLACASWRARQDSNLRPPA